MKTQIPYEQRFEHSAEAEKYARERGCAVTEYRKGKSAGSWIDLPDGTHIHVKQGKMGPAANMAVVVAFSLAGILAFLLFLLPMLGS